MAHFTTTIETRVKPEEAFVYLADFSNTAHWDPTVVRARALGPGPIGEGSRFEVVLELAGRELPFEYEITRFEPPRELVLVATSSHLRSIDTIRIEPTGEGCRLQYDADLRLIGLFYLFDFPLHLAFQISGARSSRGLERALAQRARDRRSEGAGSRA
jgi:dehydrogenase/reductase SDR family member 12